MWDNACSWTRRRLPLMAGGELTGTDRRKTERHLLGCPDCRGRLESARGAVGLLRAVASETGPSADAPSLWPSLARQLRESRRERPVVAIWGTQPMIWASSALAASLVLAAGIGVSWGLSRNKGMVAPGPDLASPKTTIAAPALSATKPKAESTHLAEGPRRDEDRPTSEINKPSARHPNLPASANRPPVETATH